MDTHRSSAKRPPPLVPRPFAWILQLGCVCVLLSHRRVGHPLIRRTLPIHTSALSPRYCSFSLSLLRSSSLSSRRAAERRGTTQTGKRSRILRTQKALYPLFSLGLLAPAFLPLSSRIRQSRQHSPVFSLAYSHLLFACALLFVFYRFFTLSVLFFLFLFVFGSNSCHL